MSNKLPQGWVECQLGEVFDIRDGTHDSPKYHDIGYPLVTSKNLKNGLINLENVSLISEKDYNKIIHIPMSSGLSETCRTLSHLAESKYPGKVYVIDNQRISITMRQSVADAKNMADDGKTAEEIRDWLTATKMQSSIYIMVDTLKYLKKGGRLTPAVAAIGTLLKIKPVLQIQGEKLDQFKKVRKLADAKTVMIDAVKADFETRFKSLLEEGRMTLSIAHTQNYAEAEIFKEEIQAAFPGVEFTFVDPLSLSVSCHIGPGALAIAACVKYIKK